MKKILTIILVALVTSNVYAGKILSNQDILSVAMTDYDKRKKANTEEMIGIHNNKKVVAIYPCGDICPNYTKRVIHYAINIKNCKKNDGVIKEIRVTRGRASNSESFCVPKVLADNWNKIIYLEI